MSQPLWPCSRILVALLLAGLSACQSSSESLPTGGANSLLCPECSPRAGGETSDFGNTSVSGCKLIEPGRALTDEEVRTYDVERARALLRDGVTARLGWLSNRRGVTSRTPESEVTLRFRATSEPLVAEETCSGSMNSWAKIEAEVDVATSDGSLRATLRGGLGRGEDGYWYGGFGADLASATGSVDLALDAAWSQFGAKIDAPREGDLFLYLEFGDGWMHGEIEAAVGYPKLTEGEIMTSTMLRAEAPVAGHFPLTHCSPLRGVPVEADQPLAEAEGRTPRMLLADANAVLERCGDRWGAEYRDGSATEVQLTLAEPADLAFCSGGFGPSHWLSWALTGSLTSSNGQLHSDITLGRAEAGAQGTVEVASSYPMSEPAALARCSVALNEPNRPRVWDGYIEQPGKRGGRACLAFPEEDGVCQFDD